jgi:regulator of RNase E activity RraA
VELSAAALTALGRASTATLTTQLLKRGFRTTFLAGLRPTRPDLRLLGHAFTLRYVPAREDVAFETSYDNETNVQRIAVESVGPGDVLVIDARGHPGAATLGDILATRMAVRGCAGIVTDGCLRDSPGFATIELPVYFRAPHATVSSVAHHPADVNLPVGCAGGDAEGAVVVPAAVAEEVALGAAEQELVEEWALERVRAGEGIRDVYPLGEARRRDYEAWRAARLA